MTSFHHSIIRSFLFVAIAALALVTTSCKNENEPKLNGFTFQVEELADQVRITVLPGTTDVYYYWSYDRASRVDGSLEAYIADQLKGKNYESAKNTSVIVCGQDSYIPSNSLEVDTKYIVYASYVRAAEDGSIELIGKAASHEFWTAPKQPSFTIYASALYDRVRLQILPEDGEAYYYYWLAKQSAVNNAGSLEAYVNNELSKQTYSKWKNGGFILHGNELNIIDPSVDDIMEPDTKYVAYACYVKEATDGSAKIVGKISAREFRTTPAHTLNGEFTVSDTKRVRFTQSNLWFDADAYLFGEYQWSYLCEHGLLTTPRGLFRFEVVAAVTSSAFQILSRPEWRYLLLSRPRADALFAHATVCDTHGLILLPDGWRTPIGVSLKTSKEMGIVWDQNQIEYLTSESYNGYAQNVYNFDQWSELEFAGAVFLPAAGFNSKEAEQTGRYWSSTPDDDQETYPGYAYHFHFNAYNVSLRSLTYSGNGDGNFYSLRLVRPVE